MSKRRKGKAARKRREEEEEEEDEEDWDEEDEEDEDWDEDEEDEEDWDEEEEEEEPPQKRRGGKRRREAETIDVKPISTKKAKSVAKRARKAMEEDFTETKPLFNPDLGKFYNMTLEEIGLTAYSRNTRYHKAGDDLVRIVFSDPDCVRLAAGDSAEGKQWIRKMKELSDDLPMDVLWGISVQKSKTSGRDFHYLYVEPQE